MSGPAVRYVRKKMTAVPATATSRAATAAPMTAGDLPGRAEATPMAATVRMPMLTGSVIRRSPVGAGPRAGGWAGAGSGSAVSWLKG